MMRNFESPAALAAAAGEKMGPGPWFEITQECIDDFAKATGDR